ncbi:MAG: chloride channel protein [Clostridia bacterium]|nr:chloride channel protein [Clostridia bacterium]
MKDARPTKVEYKNYLLEVIPIILFSALTGVLSGAIVCGYVYLTEFLAHNSSNIYAFVRENPAFIPLLLLGLIILALFVWVILKLIPEVKRLGVPRTEAATRGLKPVAWWRTLIGTILGTLPAFLGGLSLGAERPSTAIGGSIGAGIAKLYRGKRATPERKDEINLLVSSAGSGSAFATAFCAPIAGFVFTLEEIHQKFNAKLLLAAASSITTATITSTALRTLLGLETSLFQFNFLSLPLELSWTLPLIGIVCGLSAALYSKALGSICKSKRITQIPLIIKLVSVFLITGAIGLLCTDSLGSGMSLISKVTSLNLGWKVLLLLLALKALLTLLGLGSGASGGLLVPMLTLGALLGALLGNIFIALGIPENYYATFVIISMSAFLGALFRTPITAVVLAVEITGSTSGILTIGLEVFIAYIIAELLMRKPIYDVLLDISLEDYEFATSKGGLIAEFKTFFKRK